MAERAVDVRPLAEVAIGGGGPVVGWRGGQAVGRNDWLARVDAWQAALAGRPGRRWALLVDDPIEFAAALYGAWHAGKQVLLPADAQAQTLARLRDSVDGLAGELPGGVQAAAGAAAQPRRALDPQRSELVLFTSGSSGEPTAIPKLLAQLQAEVAAQHALHGERWAAAPGVMVWSTVSPQHIYGLLFVVLWPLAAGGVIAAPRLTYPEEIAGRLGPAPALLVSSPAHLRRLPPALDWARARAALRAVLSSGGPLPPEAAAETLDRLGVSPIEIFGSSETGGIAWRQRALHGERWNPIPGVQWRTDNGLLAVRSPFLPDEAWFETADRVRDEPDGGFTLLGRADRIVKIEERRISLSAIEGVLCTSPWIAEARALAHLGRIAAVVVPSAEGAALLAARGRPALVALLREALGGQVDRIALPRRWRVVDRLPVNAQGKVTAAALRALFEAPSPWRWIERSAHAARAQRQANARLAAFEGHFPQGAILPGVVQLDWAIAAGREAFAIDAPVERLEVLKFQQPVLPNTLLTLVLDWDGAARRLRFRCESARGQHASGRVCFEAAAGG